MNDEQQQQQQPVTTQEIPETPEEVFPGCVILALGEMPPADACGVLCDLVNDAFDHGGWDMVRHLSLDQLYIFGLYLLSMTSIQLRGPSDAIGGAAINFGNLFQSISHATMQLLDNGDTTSDPKFSELMRTKGVVLRPPTSDDLLLEPSPVEGLPAGTISMRVGIQSGTMLELIIPVGAQPEEAPAPEPDKPKE